MSTKYSLNVKHNGTDFGDFCIYQTDDKQDEDIRSLVWFKKTAHPGTQLHFEWGVDYSFVWSEEGEVIDLNRMTEKYEIKFPVNQYERNIELCANNTWGDMD